MKKANKSNRWQLNLFDITLDPKKHEVLMMENMNVEEKQKKIKKIHHLMCHPSELVLKKFFKESHDNDEETQQIIEDVSRSCHVCIRHKRTPPRPRAGLPVSSDFNDVVALDLKIREKNKKPILYAVDTYSRLTRGTIIKNKEPSTIVKAILETWVLGKGVGPGMPKKFLVDNGGEFNNPDVIDLAEKYGVNIHAVTPAHSPHGNGICEKNHHVVDNMMEKMIDDDPSLSDQEALNFALHAKNMEINNKGFSSYQIVFGSNPTIPGITNSTPASLEDNFVSKDVKKHIAALHLARESFRKADNDERLKRFSEAVCIRPTTKSWSLET